jgi:hypothetical protein
MNIKHLINPWGAFNEERQALNAQISELQDTVAWLKIQLEEANKNDARGKDGKYTKRK